MKLPAMFVDMPDAPALRNNLTVCVPTTDCILPPATFVFSKPAVTFLPLANPITISFDTKFPFVRDTGNDISILDDPSNEIVATRLK